MDMSYQSKYVSPAIAETLIWRIRAQRRPAAMDERPGGSLRDEECLG
jgi:hypothetical protein